MCKNTTFKTCKVREVESINYKLWGNGVLCRLTACTRILETFCLRHLNPKIMVSCVYLSYTAYISYLSLCWRLEILFIKIVNMFTSSLEEWWGLSLGEIREKTKLGFTPTDTQSRPRKMQKLQVVFMRRWTEVIYIPLEQRVQKTIRRTNTCLSMSWWRAGQWSNGPVCGYFGHLRPGITIEWFWRKAPCSCSLDTDLSPCTSRQPQPSANNPQTTWWCLYLFIKTYWQQQ